MAHFADHMEKIAESVTGGFQKIEDGVIGGYQQIEDGVVSSYRKIENAFVSTFLTKEGETQEDARTRIAAEAMAREETITSKKAQNGSAHGREHLR